MADYPTKRFRSENPPSRVLHLRNIPVDATELEIIHIGIPFGKVTNVLILKGKNQVSVNALLEMEDQANAETMCNYFENSAATIRDRRVYMQYSNHKELVVEKPSATTAAALASVGEDGKITLPPGGVEIGGNSILRIVVDHCVYTITLDVLYQIFSRFGRVLKIVIFTKNNQFQALMQMSSEQEASQAKLALEGQNIYDGCCTLRIEYSKLSVLNVKYNNATSRDYTNPTLSSGDQHMDQTAMAMGMPAAVGMHAMGMATNSPYGAAAMPTMAPRLVAHISNLNESVITCDAIFTLFGVYGNVHRVKIFYPKKDMALIQFGDQEQATTAIQYLNGVYLFGKPMHCALSKHQTIQLPNLKDDQPNANLFKDYTDSPFHRFKKPGSKNAQNIAGPSKTLHVSNIPSHMSEPDIGQLFSPYGTVTASRIITAKDASAQMALIQLSTLEQSITALIALHNYELVSTQHLHVTFAKQEL